MTLLVVVYENLASVDASDAAELLLGKVVLRLCLRRGETVVRVSVTHAASQNISHRTLSAALPLVAEQVGP